jgi:hypothetical protein
MQKFGGNKKFNPQASSGPESPSKQDFLPLSYDFASSKKLGYL